MTMEALDGMPQNRAAAAMLPPATPALTTYSDPRVEAWFLGCALVTAMPTVDPFRNGGMLLWGQVGSAGRAGEASC